MIFCHQPFGEDLLRRLITKFLNTALVTLGLAAILFVGANIAAHFALEETSDNRPKDLFGSVIWPGSPEGDRFLAAAFPDKTRAEITARRDLGPGFVMHPVLHYATAAVENSAYHIGLEGIRYEPDWTDEMVQSWLARGKNLVFVFGGSTVLGQGVANDETLTFYLNNLSDERHRFLNFGSQAYDQHREIEKLVYLLRAGHRPAHVIFLDGWNDIIDMARSNMRLADKVIFHGFSVHRGEIAFTPGSLVARPDYNNLLASLFPLTRLSAHVQRMPVTLDKINPRRDGLVDGFDFREAEYVFWNWEAFADRHRGLLKADILAYFSKNTALIAALAEGFRFGASVFYQPLGTLDPKNPFVPDDARKGRGYAHIVEMDAAIRGAISRDALPMIDLSAAFRNLDAARYVDMAHYSPAGNREIAEAILAELSQTYAAFAQD
ncbi:MAG: hypothetical protein CL566_09335 [Alphaproteobacteria bacterium]|nr:hypothetical protein [Alphaproteobacteria bacterium]